MQDSKEKIHQTTKFRNFDVNLPVITIGEVQDLLKLQARMLDISYVAYKKNINKEDFMYEAREFCVSKN